MTRAGSLPPDIFFLEISPPSSPIARVADAHEAVVLA
jgi:hypothetical protein